MCHRVADDNTEEQHSPSFPQLTVPVKAKNTSTRRTSTNSEPRTPTDAGGFNFGAKNPLAQRAKSESNRSKSVFGSLFGKRTDSRTAKGKHEIQKARSDLVTAVPSTIPPPSSPSRRCSSATSQEMVLDGLGQNIRTATLRRPFNASGMILQSLGLHISSSERSNFIVVSGVDRGSPASATDVLFVDDVLVEVDGTFVLDLSIDKIFLTLSSAGRDIVIKVTTEEAAISALARLESEQPNNSIDVEALPSSLSSKHVYEGAFWSNSGGSQPFKKDSADTEENSSKVVNDSFSFATNDTASPVSITDSPQGNDTLMAVDVKADATAAGETSGINLPTHSPAKTSTSGINLPTESGINLPTELGRGSRALTQSADDSTAQPSSEGNASVSNDSEVTVTNSSGQEYGFFVKLPPKRRPTVSEPPSIDDGVHVGKKGFLSRVFSSSSSVQNSPSHSRRSSISLAHEEPGEYIDERRISRDIISMAGSGTSAKPVGLRRPGEKSKTAMSPEPRLSLEDQVRAVLGDDSSRIHSFLLSIGLEKYMEIFKQEEIDLETLPTLTDADLEKMGVKTVGARKKILKRIAETMPMGSVSDGNYPTSISVYTSSPNAMSLSSIPITPSDLSAFSNMDTVESQ